MNSHIIIFYLFIFGQCQRQVELGLKVQVEKQLYPRIFVFFFLFLFQVCFFISEIMHLSPQELLKDRPHHSRGNYRTGHLLSFAAQTTKPIFRLGIVTGTRTIRLLTFQEQQLNTLNIRTQKTFSIKNYIFLSKKKTK